MALYEFRFVDESRSFATQEMDTEPVAGEAVMVDGITYGRGARPYPLGSTCDRLRLRSKCTLNPPDSDKNRKARRPISQSGVSGRNHPRLTSLSNPWSHLRNDARDQTKRERRESLESSSLSCFLWWPEAGLNRRHYDFQSYALPTELSGLVIGIVNASLMIPIRFLAEPTGRRRTSSTT